MTAATMTGDKRRPGLRSVRVGQLEAVAVYAACIALAAVASGALVGLTGGSAGAVVGALLDGSVRADGRLGVTLLRSAPLLAVAVGTIVANRAGLANIGQEGQVMVGAALCAFVAVRIPGPGPFALVVALLAAVVGGALWAGIAALLKYGRGVPEVISTLLLISVAAQLSTYALTKKWWLADRDPARQSQIDIGEQLADDTRLPTFSVAGNELDLGVVLAFALALVVAVVLARSVWGFRLSMLGQSVRAARAHGVSAVRMGTAALMVSGGLAGLAGGIMLAGTASGNRLTLGFSNNVGWEGLLVALLARNRPLLAIPMAVLFGALRTGSGFLAATGVDRKITDVVQALLVLALLVPPALLFLRERQRAMRASRAGSAGGAVAS